MISNIRILFVHAGGRREYIAKIKRGEEIAHDFFYGMTHLQKLGYDVDLLELDELAPDPSKWRYRWAARKDRRHNRTELIHCERFFVEKRKELQTYDVVVAGNEYCALGLLDHLRATPNAPKFLFFVMGMLSKPLIKFPRGSRQLKKAMTRYRQLLARADKAMFLGEGEHQAALAHFPEYGDKLVMTPFGIDADFWTPAPAGAKQDAFTQDDGSFLFVGNDAQRDVEMLLNIALAMPDQRFTALTSLLQQSTAPANVHVVSSHWKKGLLNDVDIRAYYRKAKAVVLPIKETHQPSGQSVALQAMACGTPVVISDFPGFWEPAAYEHGKNICFASPNKSETFVNLLGKLQSDNALCESVGEAGRNLVNERYSLTEFGHLIEKYIRSALTQRHF